MPIGEVAGGVGRIAASRSWSELGDAVQTSVTVVGAAGSAVGFLEKGMVRQSARGFDARLDSRYASLPMWAPLPGPAAVRARAPQLLEDRAATLARFPAAAPILAEGGLEAAAVLPLLVGEAAVGYLAAHYRGPHRFGEAELVLLKVIAGACAGAVARLLDGSPLSREPTARVVPFDEDSWAAVHKTMASRSVIEQAKGMLMHRFEIDSDAAWNVLRRLSSVQNVKVRDLSAALVGGDAVLGLTDRFVGETSTIDGS